MTVASAMKAAALRVAGYRPAAFFGSTQNLEMELSDLVNEVAQDVAKYQDWQALTKIASYGGNGTVTVYDLPSDYDRMTQTAMIQGDSWFCGYSPYTDMNAFIYDSESGFPGIIGAWIMYGDQIHIHPAPSQTIRYPYQSKNWARGQNGNLKSEFTDDNDEFLLPERLLTLGLVWRWREGKKLDAMGDQEAFIKALDEYAAKDGGTKIIRRNSRVVFGRARLAFPGVLGPQTYPF